MTRPSLFLVRAQAQFKLSRWLTCNVASGLKTGEEAELITSEPLVCSLRMRSEMEIDVVKSASVRTACEAMRKRLRIAARRQKELEEGSTQRLCLRSYERLCVGGLRMAGRVLTAISATSNSVIDEGEETV